MGVDRGGAPERGSWQRAVARLLNSGHRLEDVREYTLAQVVACAEELARAEVERAVFFMNMTRVAIGSAFSKEVDADKLTKALLD